MEMMSQNGESSGSWAHAFNPNTQKVEVGGLPGGLHSKFQDGQGNIGKLYVKNLRREKKEEEEEEKEEEEGEEEEEEQQQHHLREFTFPLPGLVLGSYSLR